MRRKTRVKANILHVSKEGIFDSAGKSAQIFDNAGTKPGSQAQLRQEQQQEQQTQTQSPMAKLKQMVRRNSAPQQPQLQQPHQSQQQQQQQQQQQGQPQQQTLTTRLYLQNKSLARQNSNLNTKMSALEHHMSELISENICLRQKNLELQRSHDNWLRSHVSQNLKKQLQQHINGINDLMQGLLGEVDGDSEQRSHESASQEYFELSLSRSLSKTPDSRALSRGSPVSGRHSLSRGSASRQTMGPADFARRRSSRRRSSFFGELPLLQDAEDVLDPSAEQLHLEARDVVTPMADDVEGWGEVPVDEVNAHMEEMEKQHQAEEAESEMDVDRGEKVHFNEHVEEHYDEPMEMDTQETQDTSFSSAVRETSFPSPIQETVQETSFASPEHESFPSLIQETSFPSPVKEKSSFASPIKENASFASPAKQKPFPSPIDESSFPSPFSSSFRRVTSAPRGEPMEEVSTDGESFAFLQQRSRPNSSHSRPNSRSASRNISSRPGSREKQIHVFTDPVSPVKEAGLEASAPVNPAPSNKPAAVSTTPPRSRPSLFDTPESAKERQEKERKRRESMEQVVEDPVSPCSRPSSRRSSRRASTEKEKAAEEAAKHEEMEVEEEHVQEEKVERRVNRSRRTSTKTAESLPVSTGLTTVESLEKPVSGMFEKGLEKLQSLDNNVTARKSRAPTATGGVKVTTSRKSTKATAKPSKTSPLMQKDANGSKNNGADGVKGKVETVKTSKLAEKPVKPVKVAADTVAKKPIKLETPEPRSRRSRGAPVNYKLPSVGSKLRRETDGFVDAVGGLKRSLGACDENGMKRRRI